ncbi:MAG: amidohydrolase family protein [Sphingomonas sp.]
MAASGESMRGVPFVDAHVHLWQLTRLRYRWLTPPFTDDGPNGNVAAIAQDYTLADYRAEAAGWTVVGMVHVEAGADPADALAETNWLESVAGADGKPDAIVAFAALDDPEVERLLAAQAEHGRVRGIRHIVNWHADPGRSYTSRDVTGDAAWARGFAMLAKYALSFDLQAYPGQFAGLAHLFAQHPDIPVAINHMGMPLGIDTAGMDHWRTGLTALAALPQVVIKISGAGFAARHWTEKTIRPIVLGAIDLFGPDRCLFASDFPTDRLFGTFDATLGAYAAIIADFSADERRAMWGGNANLFYRLGLELDRT